MDMLKDKLFHKVITSFFGVLLILAIVIVLSGVPALQFLGNGIIAGIFAGLLLAVLLG
jgi:hypothetical protein